MNDPLVGKGERPDVGTRGRGIYTGKQRKGDRV